MDYDFSLLKKFKIKPTKTRNGKKVMKDTRTLLKNVYNKKSRLVRKFKKIPQVGGTRKDDIETDIDEISNLHKNLKKLIFLNNTVIDIYSNKDILDE